jgi:quercetin dioxygenase-like cupin family protein
MRNRNLVVVVLAALVASAGCKKKKEQTPVEPPTPPAAQDAAMAQAPADAAEPPKPQIVTMMPADLKWTAFDEKLGVEKSGGYAVLFGDPNNAPIGVLIKSPAGNPGMPHTHSSSYHGITISGASAHQVNGPAKAKPLPAGSYWFVPGGEPHTSMCPGKEECISFAHINTGKFDFAPGTVDPKGKPDPAHVEKRPPDIKFAPLTKDKGSPQVAVVWSGDSPVEHKKPDNQAGPHGTFWKFKGGFASPPHTHTADYHAVVIKGTVMNYAPDDKAPKELGPGAYYMQPGGMAHITACKAGADCLMYSYTMGKFDFQPVGGDAGAGSAAQGSAAGSAAAGSAGSAAAGSAEAGSAAQKK